MGPVWRVLLLEPYTKDTGGMGRVDDAYRDDARYFIHRISLAEAHSGLLDWMGCCCWMCLI